jgi:hypothetical protein
MQHFSEQRQRDRRAEGDDGRSCSLDQSPKRVADDGDGQARRPLSLVDRAGRERDRRLQAGKKGIRIALGQELERPPADLGTDESKLRVQLPPLDRAIRDRLVLVDRRLDKDCGRPPRDGSKPMFESQRSFEGDSTQTAKGYRRSASLT